VERSVDLGCVESQMIHLALIVWAVIAGHLWVAAALILMALV
jgi:hypothetical protein